MKTKLFFGLIIFAFQTSLQAQSADWSITIGGSGTDKISSACFVGDDLISIGYYTSDDVDFVQNLGSYDCFIQKHDNAHNLVWRKEFGGTDTDYLYDIKPDGNNFIAVGNSKSDDNDITGNHGNFDYLVVKFDGNGDILWQKSFGGSSIDKARSVVVANGGYLVLGYSKSIDGDITSGANKGGYDIWLLKLDIDGNILWQKNLGGSADDKAHKIYAASATEYYITAYSKSSDGDLTQNAGNYDFWILKIDDTGTIIWQQSYGGSSIDKEPVLNFDMGDLFVVGPSNSSDGVVQNSNGNFDYLLLALSRTDGQLLWSKNYGGPDADFPTGIKTFPMPVRNTNPDMYIFGYSNSEDGDFNVNQGNYDAWILGLGLDGSVISTQNVGGTDIDKFTGYTFNDMSSTTNFVLYGTTKSNDGNLSVNQGSYDAWLYGTMLNYGNGIDALQMNLECYPVPAQNYLTVNCSNDITQIDLFDTTGRIIFNQKFDNPSNSRRLNISVFETGNYILKVHTKRGYLLRKIIIK